MTKRNSSHNDSSPKQVKGPEPTNWIKERVLLRKLMKTKIYRISFPDPDDEPFNLNDFLREEYDQDEWAVAYY